MRINISDSALKERTELNFSRFDDEIIECDGHRLCRILSLIRIPEDIAKEIKMQIIFWKGTNL